MAGGPTRRRRQRRHRRSPPLPSPGRSVPVPPPGISPTVFLLQRFKAASGRQEAALVDSNNLAREWRGESNLFHKMNTEKRYLSSRGNFEEARNFCLKIADDLLRRETVTVRNRDDIDWIGRLDALYGVLGSVRVRGHAFEGGLTAFHELVDDKNLQAVVE